MSLRATLERFARELAQAPAQHEGVSIEVTRRDGFVNDATTAHGLAMRLDEPVVFGGEGSAPDPAETLLAAVGASLSVTLTAHATLRGIAIDGVRVALRASIDGAAFFHPDAGGRPGLLDATLTLTVTSGSPAGDVRRVVRDALRVAPVLRSLKRMPRVTLVIERPT